MELIKFFEEDTYFDKKFPLNVELNIILFIQNPEKLEPFGVDLEITINFKKKNFFQSFCKLYFYNFIFYKKNKVIKKIKTH